MVGWRHFFTIIFLVVNGWRQHRFRVIDADPRFVGYTEASLALARPATAWPPLTAAAPTSSGLSGKLTVVNDAHGGQLAYNGHLLYTFITDRPGQVTGQGVQKWR